MSPDAASPEVYPGLLTELSDDVVGVFFFPDIISWFYIHPHIHRFLLPLFKSCKSSWLAWGWGWSSAQASQLLSPKPKLGDSFLYESINHMWSKITLYIVALTEKTDYQTWRSVLVISHKENYWCLWRRIGEKTRRPVLKTWSVFALQSFVVLMKMPVNVSKQEIKSKGWTAPDWKKKNQKPKKTRQGFLYISTYTMHV